MIGCRFALSTFRRVLRNNLAVVDDGNALRHSFGFIHIVRCQEHSYARLDSDASHGPELVASLRIEAQVGSSRNKIFGVWSKPRAISKRRFIPPE